MKKKLLLVGANSALAQAVKPLLAESHTIVTAGRKDCDVYCDLAGEVTVPDDIDVVINFAASFGGISDEEIAAAVDINVKGMLKLCMAAKAAKIEQLISISSIFALLDETSPFYSSYAMTKKQADELAQFYCKLNRLPLTTLRPSRIYGDSDSFAKNQPFLYQIIDKAQHGEAITLYGTNDAHRNYIHSHDLAEIVDRVITQGVEGTYSCVYPTEVTYSALAKTAQEVFGTGGEVTFLRDKPDIPSDGFVNDSTLYDTIQYHPEVSIQAGLERIKQYRERASQ